MPYSYHEVPAVSVGQSIPVPFPFMLRDHVSVAVQGNVVDRSKWAWASDGLIVAGSGFPSGSPTRVYRTTPMTSLVAGTLSGSAVFDYEGVNSALLQVLYLAQERADYTEETYAKIISLDSYIADIFAELEVQEDQVAALVQKAKDWANKAVDSVVEGGEYSAKHYATKAGDERELARLWAEKDPGEEVAPGQYSARHWAAAIAGTVAAMEAATDALQGLAFYHDFGLITEAAEAPTDYGTIT